MKTPDSHIKNIFSSKLKDVEASVSDHLWTAIEQHLPASTATAGSVATASKISLLKWISAVVIGGALTAGGIYFFQNPTENTAPLEETVVSVSPENSVAQDAQILTADTIALFPLPTEKQEISIAQKKKKVSPTDTSIEEKNTPNEAIDSFTEKKSLSENAVVTPNTTHSATEPTHVANIQEETKTTPGAEETPTPKDTTANPLTAFFTALPVDEENLRWFFFAAEKSDASFEWSMSDGTFDSGRSVSHSFQSEGDFTIELKVVDESGNTKIQKKNISVILPGKLNVVNAFSPGKNGKNDQIDFLSQSRNIAKLDALIIADSKGIIVFKSDTSSIWNGENAYHNPVPAGAYRYVIRVVDTRGEIIEKAGNLQLFRE